MTEVCFDKNCFRVEIASTAYQRQRGLMGRKSLEKDKGMLFIFEKEEIHPFWMKETLISIDIIWLNKNKEVVFIKESAAPCQEICEPIIPSQKASYVLEINGGLAKKINLKAGDRASIDLGALN